MLYILTSVWMLQPPNAGQNFSFPFFCRLLHDFYAKIMKNEAKRVNFIPKLWSTQKTKVLPSTLQNWFNILL